LRKRIGWGNPDNTGEGETNGGMGQSRVSSQQFAYPARRLAKNTAYNVLGRVLPMVAAAVAVPFLLRELGIQRFGVLTLLWLVIGYFGIFDIGVGRATTKFVAEEIASGERGKLLELIWGSVLLLLLLGVVGGGVAALLTPWLVERALNIPPELKAESRNAFLLLAASMPFVLGTSGARGVLEGQHRFGVVNAIRAPGSVFTFAGPLLVTPFTTDLSRIAAVLVCGRVVVFCVNAYFCVASVPGQARPKMVRGDTAKHLFGFGGWLTVTNIVGALMAFGFVDRFVISSSLDMSAVSYYAVPFEAATKLLLAPAGFVAVLFPVFSGYAGSQKERVQRLCLQAVRILLMCLSPAALVLIAFGALGLNLWVGEEFARQSARVLQLVVAGVLVCSFSLVFASAIQALGRPDLTAKRHVCELPIYVALVWFLTKQWGIAGTAASWLIWQLADYLILLLLLGRLLPRRSEGLWKSAKLVTVCGGGALLCGGLLAAIPNPGIRAAGTLGGLAAFVMMFWKFGMEAQDKAKVRSILGLSAKASREPTAGKHQ